MAATEDGGGIKNAHVVSHDGDCRARHKNVQERDKDQLSNGDVLCHQQTTSRKRHTLTAEEVDFVFVEPYIMTGYRLPNQPWRYYFFSAFWLHNESLNVWTHAIGCLCVVIRALFLGLELDGFSDPRSTPVIGFALACFLTNLLSFLAHLLHSRSPRHHYILFFTDYAGITLYNLGNAIGSMYSCSHPHMYAQMEVFYLPVVVILSWLAFLACVLARLCFLGHFSVKRKLIMIVVLTSKAGFIAWPMVGRYVDCIEEQGCSLSSLHHITVVFVFFGLDGVCFVAHAPERWWPGRFDIWGHGHQWFHVCTIVTQQLQLHALHVDLVELERGHHALSLDLFTMLASFVCLGLATMVTIIVLSSAVDRKVAENRARPAGDHAKDR